MDGDRGTKTPNTCSVVTPPAATDGTPRISPAFEPDDPMPEDAEFLRGLMVGQAQLDFLS